MITRQEKFLFATGAIIALAMLALFFFVAILGFVNEGMCDLSTALLEASCDFSG